MLLNKLCHLDTLRMKGPWFCCPACRATVTWSLGSGAGQHPRRGGHEYVEGVLSTIHSSPWLCSCPLLHLLLLLPTTAGFLLSPRLGASDTNVVFLPGHLQKHVGGKLDCEAESRKYDLLEWFDGESHAFWKLQEVCRGSRELCSNGLWCELPEPTGEASNSWASPLSVQMRTLRPRKVSSLLRDCKARWHLRQDHDSIICHCEAPHFQRRGIDQRGLKGHFISMSG